MAFGDSLADLMGLGSPISEHIAETPGLAREMRYSPSNAGRQDMQDYLAPLAAQDFAADARSAGDVGGMAAALGSPLYVAAKAVAPEWVSRQTGTGEALTSAPSLNQIMRAYRGLAVGQRDPAAAPEAAQPSLPAPASLPVKDELLGTGLTGLGSDLLAWAMRQRGYGMDFPPATQAHPAYRGGGWR